MNLDDSQPLDNDARGALAEVGLQAFADRVYGGETDRDLSLPESFEQAVSDLLANLMHSCKSSGSDFDGLVARARRHFEAEVFDEAEEFAQAQPGAVQCPECGSYSSAKRRRTTNCRDAKACARRVANPLG